MKTILLLAVSQICAIAFADVVTLKDGRQITGQVEFGVSSQIRIRTGEKSQMVAIDQIQSIQFDPLEEPPAPTRVSAAPMTAAPPSVSPAPSAQVLTPAPVAAPSGITLPAGTEIAVRTIQPMDSKKADLYKEYAASLDDPIVVDGVTLAPANANAVLRIAQVQSSGVTRRATLSTILVAVFINGHRVDVKTDKVDSKSGSQAKQTATGAAVGAGAGAAVGAMAGGAIGAGIGAGVGAAAGTAAAVLKGKPVEIKSETRFTYKLTEPVVLTVLNPEKPR